MKARDRSELCRYVRAVADEMGLRDWTFVVSHDQPPNDAALASVLPTYGRRQAVLKFADCIRHVDLDEVRQVVVHELVHCHAAPVDQHLENEVGTLMGKRQHKGWWLSMDWVLERMVDDLAMAVAPHMPLIKWPEPKPKKKGK